jgi:hypothetical protein
MTQVKGKMFGAWIAILLLLGASSCVSQCVLMHSEFYDVTGKMLTPKPESQDVPVLSKTPDRPFVEIGEVIVEAPLGTSAAVINAEMMGRARQAGADAVVEAANEENKDNKVLFCGKLFDTKKSVTARGTAIVYADKGPDA